MWRIIRRIVTVSVLIHLCSWVNCFWLHLLLFALLIFLLFRLLWVLWWSLLVGVIWIELRWWRLGGMSHVHKIILVLEVRVWNKFLFLLSPTLGLFLFFSWLYEFFLFRQLHWFFLSIGHVKYLIRMRKGLAFLFFLQSLFLFFFFTFKNHFLNFFLKFWIYLISTGLILLFLNDLILFTQCFLR